MQNLPESTSCHLTRNLVTAVALVGFCVLSLATLNQRHAVDGLETRIAVLEQQNLRLTTSVQALEEAAREDQDEAGTSDLIDPFAGDDTSADEASSDDDVEELVNTAQELYVQGQYEIAAAVVEPATRVAETADRAWRILGATNCFMHDGKNAARALAKLDSKGQAFVRYVCEKNDIKL